MNNNQTDKKKPPWADFRSTELEYYFTGRFTDIDTGPFGFGEALRLNATGIWTSLPALLEIKSTIARS